MDRMGYRKVERYEPNFRQWLQQKGEKDKGVELFFHARRDRQAIFRLYDGNSDRQARRVRQQLCSEALRQINEYHDAIERGDVETVVEYEPLDMEDEADRAYLRVQQKRAQRKQQENRLKGS